MDFKRKLLTNLTEYREWAFDISELNQEDYVENALGIERNYECWDTIQNEAGEWIDIDESGNRIPEDTAESIKLSDWVYGLEFPVIAIYCFDKDWDRTGDLIYCICDFVSKNEFDLSSFKPN